MASSAPGMTDGLGMKGSASLLTPEASPSFFDNPFMKGVSSVMNYADKNPFKSAGIAYMGAKRLGLLDDNAPTAANRVHTKPT